MVLGTIVLLLVLAITYFHYVQGILSATISAVLCVMAATLAVGHHEVLGAAMRSSIPEQADAIALVLIFALTYGLLRVLFDQLVPGNVQVPLYVDRVGAAAMGLVAGIFSTGVVVVAAQMLPFGGTIGGYGRFAIRDDREVTIVSGGKSVDAVVKGDLEEDRFTPETASGLLIPVDTMLVGLVDSLSSSGALSGRHSLSSVHPAYLDELFASRLGIQPGLRRVAINTESAQQASVKAVYLATPKQLLDAEVPTVRDPALAMPQVGAGQAFLAVRMTFHNKAADEVDGVVRFSPGAVRLYANSKNYYPVGTMERGALLVNRVDDMLAVPVKDAERGGDFVFLVEEADLLATTAAPAEGAEAAPAEAEMKIADGVFVEFKRQARIDLSGQTVAKRAPAAPPTHFGILRKALVMSKLPVPAPATKPVTTGAASRPGPANAPPAR